MRLVRLALLTKCSNCGLKILAFVGRNFLRSRDMGIRARVMMMMTFSLCSISKLSLLVLLIKIPGRLPEESLGLASLFRANKLAINGKYHGSATAACLIPSSASEKGTLRPRLGGMCQGLDLESTIPLEACRF